MSVRMQPLVVDGRLRPELDIRWVPISVMAAYTGLSPQTLWKRMVGGQIPTGCTRAFGPHGGRTLWLPAAYFADARRLAGVAP